MKTLINLLSIVLLSSCINGNIEYYRNKNADINIYIVKDSQIEIHQSDIDLNSLNLENKAWVKNADIEFYDWSAHSFYLNKEVDKGQHSGKHFVVTSGSKRLFAGIFFPMYMSSFPSLPTISPEDGFFSPKDVVRFGHFGFTQPGGLNENINFKAELIAAGILRQGIEVELENLNRINSSTLKYTFSLTNRETDFIYVLDPHKMGDSRFHYFTNGVSLSSGDRHYWPQNFEATPSESIKSSWYYRLAPGRSITRTVEMSGYSSLPSGKVKATFQFPGANLKDKGSWKKPDGRIWLGDFTVEKELMLR